MITDEVDLVTRASALAAIAHIGQWNGPGSERVAIKLLEAVAPMLVPDGWKLVPTKPTLDMYRAFIMRNKNPRPDDGWNDAYQAMLAAAPTPPNTTRPND